MPAGGYKIAQISKSSIFQLFSFSFVPIPVFNTASDHREVFWGVTSADTYLLGIDRWTIDYHHL